MILDEVLYESREFTTDDMVDIFTEGFLFALEMQEARYKAGSTEELSESIAEAANIAISEISAELANHAAQKARYLSANHYDKAKTLGKRTNLNQKNYEDKYSNLYRDGSRSDLHKAKGYKYSMQAKRINAAIARKNDRIGFKKSFDENRKE